ncbi:carcinoembryonic antigen-related cell adhesion molecule 1-like [Peromyscus eremicus]|uniref:carcinoembryonic antigen-related cell adhesion molecule 1-like n=1 Tax=Peromyscus eremicus TaxID=42410 RepID=UPI0027DE29A1|nr:carcinoembryonic antigen-related cell adhesion molecule 1-like [Peromyscus eremicus]
MELTSAPLHKAEVSWRGLLLTVSLLTYWTSPTTAKVTVEAVPPHVAEGKNVVLVVHNLPAKYAVINWYKGQGSLKKLIAKFVKNQNSIQNGPGYTHREMIYPNGSLFINNVTMEDEELYTLYLEIDSTHHQNVTVNFDVQRPVSKPFIQVSNKTNNDLISVLLNCFSFDSGISIHWFYKGQSLKITNRMILSKDNNTLTIVPARRNDSGDYYCEVSNQISSKKSDPIQLEVIEPVTTPSIQVTNTTVKDLISVFLNCLSNDTEISIHWLFKGQSLSVRRRMKLSKNNKTLEIYPARSEDSGDYQCEVSNQVSSKKSDPIQLGIIEPVTPPSIQVTNSTVKNLISVFLTCLSNGNGISIHWLFQGQSLVITNRMRLSENNHTLQIDSVRTEDSGDYQCEVSNQVSSKRSDPIQLDIIRESPKPKHLPSLRGIIGIVAQCLMGMIAVIFLLGLLWRRHHGREPQIENDIKQVDNEPTNLNEPTNANEPSNLNETSKAASNVKKKKKKKSKGKK